MQHETSRPLSEEDLRTQQAILGMLVTPDGRRPWSIAEVQREIGEDEATTDALAHLHAAGLIHRVAGFVFATRAAVHSDRLAF